MVKQILFLFFLILLLNSLFLNTTPVKADCVTNGLVLWLRFDEGQGNIAYDYSGNNNNAILYNNPTWVQGKYGYALSFNGLNQYGTVSLSNSLNITTPITLMAWVYIRSTAQLQNVIADYDPSTLKTQYALRVNSGTSLEYYYRTTSNSWSVYTVNNVLQLNSWQHIAVTNNGTNINFYVNGNSVGSFVMSGNIAYSPAPVQISGVGGANQVFDGVIDEVRIYNRALSQSEIQQIYSQTQPNFCQFTTSTTVYQNQIVQTNTAQGYSYFAIDPYNIGVLVLILIIGFLFFVFERRLILIGIGIGFLIAYFFLGINIGFVLLGFIFIILNIILLRRYET